LAGAPVAVESVRRQLHAVFQRLAPERSDKRIKAIRTRVLRSIDWTRFSADGYGFIVEFHFLAFRAGFQICEVPIVFTERRRGASKMSVKIMLESAGAVFRLACHRSFHRRLRRPGTAAESLTYA
jgi:hypothetical protein